MKNEKIDIHINGEETSKSEIVYNNLIENMKLTEKDQLNYLKAKVINLELEEKNKRLTILLSIISLIGIGFGCYLLVADFHFLGILFIFGTFIGVMIRSYLMFKNVLSITKSTKYDKIESIRKILDSKLK